MGEEQIVKVHVPQIQHVERIVEVPQVQVVQRHVHVPGPVQIVEQIRHVPKLIRNRYMRSTSHRCSTSRRSSRYHRCTSFRSTSTCLARCRHMRLSATSPR